jgi:hypothetical protein
MKIRSVPIRIVAGGIIIRIIRIVVTGQAMYHSLEIGLLVTPQNTTWITRMRITMNLPKDVVDADTRFWFVGGGMVPLPKKPMKVHREEQFHGC